MKKLITLSLLVLFSLVSSVSANEWDKIRIGVEGAYPPFSWIEKDGTLKGFDIDIARALCEEIGIPDTARDLRFRTNQQRVIHRDTLSKLLEERIRQRERESLLAALRLRKVPVGAVRTIDEILKEPASQSLLLDGQRTDGESICGLRTIAFESDAVELPELLGAPPDFNISVLAKKSLYVTRPSLGPHTAKPKLTEEIAGPLFDAIKNGLTISINQTYNLKDAAEAHLDLQSRKTTGSAILEI